MAAPTYDKLTPPKTGSRVTVESNGRWQIPDDPIVCLLRGDGIGCDVGSTPGITTCAARVLDGLGFCGTARVLSGFGFCSPAGVLSSLGFCGPPCLLSGLGFRSPACLLRGLGFCGPACLLSGLGFCSPACVLGGLGLCGTGRLLGRPGPPSGWAARNEGGNEPTPVVEDEIEHETLPFSSP